MDTWVWAVTFNVVFWAGIFFAQYIEYALGHIRPRRRWGEEDDARVPWMQDWWTAGPLGDLLALSLINAAVVPTMWREGLGVWILLVGLLGLICSRAYYKMATHPARVKKNIDWGLIVKDGVLVKLSWSGRAHVAYFTFQSAVSLVGGISFLVSGRLTGSEIVVGLIGTAIYLVAFAMDIAQGHFAREEQGSFR